MRCSASCASPVRSQSSRCIAAMPGRPVRSPTCSRIARCRPMCRNGFDLAALGRVIAVRARRGRFDDRLVLGVLLDDARRSGPRAAPAGDDSTLLAPCLDVHAAQRGTVLVVKERHRSRSPRLLRRSLPAVAAAGADGLVLERAQVGDRRTAGNRACAPCRRSGRAGSASGARRAGTRRARASAARPRPRARSSPGASPVRFATRNMCVSTAIVGWPNAVFRITLAVLRPTPGSASSASRSSRHLAAVLVDQHAGRSRRCSSPCPGRGRSTSRRPRARRRRARGSPAACSRPRTAVASRGSRSCRSPAPRGSPRPAARTASRTRVPSSGADCVARSRSKIACARRGVHARGLVRRSRRPAAAAAQSRARRQRRTPVAAAPAAVRAG